MKKSKIAQRNKYRNSLNGPLLCLGHSCVMGSEQRAAGKAEAAGCIDIEAGEELDEFDKDIKRPLPCVYKENDIQLIDLSQLRTIDVDDIVASYSDSLQFPAIRRRVGAGSAKPSWKISDATIWIEAALVTISACIIIVLYFVFPRSLTVSVSAISSPGEMDITGQDLGANAAANITLSLLNRSFRSSKFTGIFLKGSWTNPGCPLLNQEYIFEYFYPVNVKSRSSQILNVPLTVSLPGQTASNLKPSSTIYGNLKVALPEYQVQFLYEIILSFLLKNGANFSAQESLRDFSSNSIASFSIQMMAIST